MDTNAIARRVASSYLPGRRISRTVEGGLDVSRHEFSAAWKAVEDTLGVGTGPLSVTAFREAYRAKRHLLAGLSRMVADFSSDMVNEAGFNGFQTMSPPCPVFSKVVSSCRVCPSKVMLTGIVSEAEQ